jgi:plastocyanin
MRRLPALVLVVLVVVVIAACSASASPGWTYAPAASAAPAASGTASGAPSVAPSQAPSVAPSLTPSVAPSASASESASASGGAATLTITAPVGAATGGFQPTTVEATANKPFTIHFDNQDNQAPHNVTLKGPSGDVTLGGDTAFFTGPGTRDYAVPALPAGDYAYSCAVHPTTMKGTLTVK